MNYIQLMINLIDHNEMIVANPRKRYNQQHENTNNNGTDPVISNKSAIHTGPQNRYRRIPAIFPGSSLQSILPPLYDHTHLPTHHSRHHVTIPYQGHLYGLQKS